MCVLTDVVGATAGASITDAALSGLAVGLVLDGQPLVAVRATVVDVGRESNDEVTV